MDNNTDNNQDKAEFFLTQVRELVEEQMKGLQLVSLTELLVGLVAHIALRDMKVANGCVVEPELAKLADAAVYFMNESGLTLKFSTGHEE